MIILIVYFNQSLHLQLSLCGIIDMCGWIVSGRSQIQIPTVDFSQNLFNKYKCSLPQICGLFYSNRQRKVTSTVTPAKKPHRNYRILPTAFLAQLMSYQLILRYIWWVLSTVLPSICLSIHLVALP